MTSRATPHGSSSGNHIAAKGRNLISRIRRDDKKEHEVPNYRKFDGQVFRILTYQPTIKEANYYVEEYKENFFIRKVRLPGNRGYVIYVREKGARRGQ
jgi:hypothetical protein